MSEFEIGEKWRKAERFGVFSFGDFSVKNFCKTWIRKLVKMIAICLTPFGDGGTKSLVIGLGESVWNWSKDRRKTRSFFTGSAARFSAVFN